MERTIKDVLRNQEQCKPREYDREILEIAYKSRNNIPLTPREREIGEAYFRRRG